MATVEVTANAQQTLPTAAGGSSITPNASAWVNSAYTQMSASIGSAITIFGVTVKAGIAAEFEVDIARGAATAEVVVATFIGAAETLAGSSMNVFYCNIPVDDIASGQRVSCRLRKSGTDTTAWTVKVIYFNTVASTVGVTANHPTVAPSAAAGVSVTPNGTAWVNSAYGELSASVSNIVALGFVVNPAGTVVSGGTEFELDIATGAATAEVVVGTTGANWETFAGVCNLIPFRIPISIAGTVRISTRMRKIGTDTTAWTVKLLYVSASGFGTSAIQKTTNPQKINPDAAAAVGNTGSATAWANSAWLQLIASTANAIVIVGRGTDTAASVDYELDCGTGAATAEVVIASDADLRFSNLAANHLPYYGVPIDNVAASTRVSFRHRDSDSSANAFESTLTYYDKSGL